MNRIAKIYAVRQAYISNPCAYPKHWVVSPHWQAVRNLLQILGADLDAKNMAEILTLFFWC